MRPRGTSARFVGRLAERALLDELLATARAGEPVTVLVCGEAGAGKTRLVTELVTDAGSAGTPALVGSCTAVGRRSFAFAPFVDALRPLVRGPVAESGEDRGAPGPGLARLVAGVDDDTGSRDPPDAATFGMFTQLRLFEEVLDAVEHEAERAGLLVVIDDLHWADRSSLGLFEFLSRSLHRTGVLLAGTVRTDEPDDPGFMNWLAEVQRGPQALRLDLERFRRDELADLVAGVRGEPPSAELVDRVYDRSGGNAFMAEEILAADERGVLVPATVGSPVLARAATLSASARRLLRLAAVAGVQVSHGLLAAAAGLDDEPLLAAARELTESHLLIADPSCRGYAFRHALTREAVEADLLPGERQQLHRAMARALTDEPAVGPPATWAAAEAVAEHWLAAGDDEQALVASIAAGDAARGVAAVAAALGHDERALDLWHRVADPEAVAGVALVELWARAAEAASGSGEHERALRHIDAAIRELEATAAPPGRLGLLCERKGWYLGWASQGDAVEWTERAVELVPADPPTVGRAHVLAAHALALMIGGGHHDEASRVATAALEAARRVGDRTEEARARGVLGACLVMTSADPRAGIRELEQAVAVGRTSGDVETVALWSSNLTDGLMRLGRFDEAAAAGLAAAHEAVRSRALRNEVGFVLVSAAEALFVGGRWDECVQALDQVREQRAGGLMELWGLGLGALLHAVRGADDAAAAGLAEAAELGLLQAEGRATVAAAQAHLALHRGELDVARCATFDGLDALESDGSEPGMATTASLADLGLRIESDRARLAHAQGRRVVEHDAVASARAVAIRTLDQCLRAAAAAHRPEVARAHRALAEAELGRAEGRSDPDAWQRAVDAAPGARHRCAYAGFRLAEAVLSSRRGRARAADVLRTAHATARDLGAGPLAREIEDLARRARIELTDRGEPVAGGDPPASVGASLGLTAREMEVLRLLAAGYSNPQIGEALYISRKTASHHVSSILTKLDVSTRVEAAGVAHRVGLTSGTAALD